MRFHHVRKEELMSKSLLKVFLLIFAIFLFSGCAGSDKSVKNDSSKNAVPKEPELAILYVGVTPNYPPMIFKSGDDLKGVEADLARRLAKALNKKVQFVELDWNRQINALMEGKIDIVMSGMTITDARKVRINFADPYLKIGLMTLIRAEDANKFNSLKRIREGINTVGVVQGTTSEVFVRNTFPKTGTILSLKDGADGAYYLSNRRIDLFIHDGPSIAWLASENEGVLRVFWEPLDEEHLAWAVRKDDQDFLAQVNTTLGVWKKDGTLKEIISRWLPYWKNFE